MKKVLIMMMCVIMVVCFMPTVAFAAEGEPEPTYEWYGDGSGDEFILSTAADLLGFAKKVNDDGVTFNGKTVKLGADVDLAGIEWIPVSQTNGYYAKTYFQGTFDGQNNTISNMTITNTNSGGNYAAGFFGFIDNASATIKNLVFDKATVKGHHNTAVVVGYLSGSVTNCTVKNSTVIATLANDDANGDKVGGIAGYVNPQGSINNNTVINTTIKGYRDVGGIVGGIGGDPYNAINSCNVQNTNVYYSITDTEKRGGIYIGKRFESFIGTENKDTGCNVYVEVANANELINAINNAGVCANVELIHDITVANDSQDKNSSVITIEKNITLDGNGHTITADSVNWTQAVDSESKPVPTRHLIGIQGGAKVTVNDLTIVGNEKTKHGMNVWTDYNVPNAVQADVTLNNVTIQNCGTAGLVVVNSKVTATNLQTSGNAWGAVNVDKGTPSFTLVSGNLAEEAKVWSELTGDALQGIELPTNWKVVKTETENNVTKTFYAYVAPIYVPPTPTTPTDNVTNSGSSAADNATTSADLSNTTSTSNGTTTATVDKTTADKIVDKAVKNKSTEVVIDATANTTTAADSTTIAQVTIPTETLGAIAEKTEADVTIKTDVAEVKMDNAAAAAVSEQAEGDTVQIIAEKVKEDATEVHFELKVVCSDGKVISDFKGGNVAVTVALPKAMADKKAVCVYIDDNGHMSKVEGQKNADGTYTFVTGHFSSYAILAEEEADAAIAAQKEAIKNIKIKLTSKQVKTKTGKKGIKITWTAAAGDKVLDGVEVFRSTERYKGYGTEPFYTSTKGGNTGSYTNTKSLKKGTKYYYRVRGYVLVDGQKVYTDYSTKAWRTVK